MDSWRYRSSKDFNLGWWNSLASAWFPGFCHFENFKLGIQFQLHLGEASQGNLLNLFGRQKTIFFQFLWKAFFLPVASEIALKCPFQSLHLQNISVTLTQGHSCGIDKYKFACLRDSVRTTLPITTKLGGYIPLVIPDFGWILLEMFFFFSKFALKILDVFFQGQTLLHISQEWLVRSMWNEKEVHWLDTAWIMWSWPLTSPMTLTFDFSRSNFKVAVSQELLWNRKKADQSDTGLTVCLCPLTTPMSLTL